MESLKKHVFLIGFMGSGKTSLGKLLAKKLNFDFLDTDRHIEEQENCSIQEIFNSKGESYFRELEHQLLKNISQSKKATVFSTGGGMPIFNENLYIMKEKGIVIFLNVPLGMLYFRLKNDTTRPLLSSKENLLNFLETTLNQRIPIYSLADFEIDARQNKLELVDEIINLIIKK